MAPTTQQKILAAYNGFYGAFLSILSLSLSLSLSLFLSFFLYVNAKVKIQIGQKFVKANFVELLLEYN
jgi:hypothetical protein